MKEYYRLVLVVGEKGRDVPRVEQEIRLGRPVENLKQLSCLAIATV